jgi:hypothetical protein
LRDLVDVTAQDADIAQQFVGHRPQHPPLLLHEHLPA